jgi:hypothetical protein
MTSGNDVALRRALTPTASPIRTFAVRQKLDVVAAAVLPLTPVASRSTTSSIRIAGTSAIPPSLCDALVAMMLRKLPRTASDNHTGDIAALNLREIERNQSIYDL